MSPRHPLLLAVPVAMALGLSASGAAAMQPADGPVRPRVAAQPSVASALLTGRSVVGDGGVSDVVQRGDTVYALGSFDEIGRYTGPGRILDGETGADLPAPVFDDGQVSVVLADGTGGWYVAGDAGSGVVHVLADGSLDPAFGVQVGGDVYAIARDGDTLYVGGAFSAVNQVERRNIAAISATTGTLRSFRPDLTGRVTELVHAPAADGVPATLYVGGNGLAAVDPATGAVRMSTGAFGGDVRALALGDGVVYVGTGELYAIDPVSGTRLDEFDPDLASGTVHTLLLDGDRLYVGSDGGADRLVALDAGTGDPDASFDPEVGGGEASWGQPGGVFDLALDGDRIWVAGAFTQAGGEPAGGLAVLDAASGAATGLDLPRFHHQVNAVEVSGGAAYVGGHFYLDDPVRTGGLAALDADTLLPVPGFHAPDSGYRPGELTVAPNAVYVAPTHFLGYYPQATQPPYFPDTTATVHAFDPATGAALPARTRTVEDLTGLTTLGGSLVVAQRLQDDVRFPRNRVTVYQPNGRRLTSWQVPLRGYITELGVIGGDLLVAGSFKRSRAGFPRNTALLRLDLETGERRAYFDPRIHGPVNDISVLGGSIYASGMFTKVHQGLDQRRPGLVRLTARSTKSERFDPAMRGGDLWWQRATAVGGLVWAQASPQRFLDATTGERVTPFEGVRNHWLQAVTGDADSLVVGGRQYTGLAGHGALEVGYVTLFPR